MTNYREGNGSHGVREWSVRLCWQWQDNQYKMVKGFSRADYYRY